MYAHVTHRSLYRIFPVLVIAAVLTVGAARVQAQNYRFVFGKPAPEKDKTVDFVVHYKEYGVAMRKTLKVTTVENMTDHAKMIAFKKLYDKEIAGTDWPKAVDQGKYNSNSGKASGWKATLKEKKPNFSVTKIEVENDDTGQRDWRILPNGKHKEVACLDLRLQLPKNAVATGKTLGGMPSEFAFGVADLYVSTIPLVNGMTGESIIQMLYYDLTQNPDSPQKLKDATSLIGDDLVVDFQTGTVASADWAFGGGYDDAGLAGQATLDFGQAWVPEPASVALLLFGGLLRLRRPSYACC